MSNMHNMSSMSGMSNMHNMSSMSGMSGMLSNMERVQKIIANSGHCSRRKAEDLIKQGKVRVNGKIISIGDKADKEKDKISVEGKILRMPKKIYKMMNKPKGYLVTLAKGKSEKDRKTITDLLDEKERIIPIGRLDYNSEGMLLLTNDGDFANRIMHPRYNIRKHYLVSLEEPITDIDMKKLGKGVIIDNKSAIPDKLTKINDNKIEIVIHEGRNRIIRRIFKKLGYRVTRLKRIQIGNIKLDIDTGKIRSLRKDEIRQLSQSYNPKNHA